MTSPILLATVAAAVGMQAVTAHAEPPETRSIAVHFADLDLSSAPGVRALRGRIQEAARIVCGDYEAIDLKRNVTYYTCVRRATDAALAQIALPAR
jgi:UrcA family protein